MEEETPDSQASDDSLDKRIEKYVNEIIDTKHPNLTLDDICGCKDVKELLKECIILPIKFPQLFTGRRTPWKGTLLYGAPGAGKTMLIKALGGECPDIPFLRVVGSDLISKYYGEPDRIVKECFKKARKLRPCILLIDDVTELLSNDQTQYNKARSELLVQIQDIGQDNGGIHSILTSSEPWKIQRSFIRGLNKKILVPMPDKESRKQIFKKMFESSQVKCEISDEDFEIFGEKSEGYTGADICCVVRDAAMETVREIQKATHFRKVEFQSTDSPAEKVFQYPVCSSDHPDAIAMTFTDLMNETDKLFERATNKNDVLKCLSKSKPSIDDEYLKQLGEFAKEQIEC